MSTYNQRNQTGNQQITDYNVSKLFVWKPRFRTGTYTNSTGDTVTLAQGQLMARITTSGLWVPHDKSASDGSEIPRGVLAKSYTVADSASQDINIAYQGDVASALLVLSGSDTLETVVTGKGRIIDLLMANTAIIPVGGDELTGYDN